MVRKYRIGVFDSGVGGKAFVDAIKAALPDSEVILAEDKQNLPYGNKKPKELLNLVTPILNTLSKEGCEAIVVACNTVSTNIIGELRRRISTPLIAVEPMIKPAAESTKSGVIAVCATSATLKSQRYIALKHQFAKNLQVVEPDCSDWAEMIEGNKIEHSKVEDSISKVCEAGADVIVLGCTHYHWIEDEICSIAKRYDAKVIQPTEAVIKQLIRVLKRPS